MTTYIQDRDDYRLLARVDRIISTIDRQMGGGSYAADMTAGREHLLTTAAQFLPDDYELSDKADDEIRRDTLIAAGHVDRVFHSNARELRDAFDELAAKGAIATSDNGRSQYKNMLSDAWRNAGAK